MKVIRIVPFITTFVIMAMIFAFSSQNSTESSHLSRGLTEKIVNILPVMRSMSAEEKTNIILGIHNIIRKCAHFTIYASLGFSAAAMFLSITPKRRMLYIWICALIFSCIYACTDEFHQLFVGGRGGKIRDIILDTAGGMTGAGLFILMRRLFFRLKNRIKNYPN